MTIKLIWYLETTELKWMFSHTKQNAHQHYYFYTGILNLLFNWYFLLKLLNVIELNKYVLWEQRTRHARPYATINSLVCAVCAYISNSIPVAGRVVWFLVVYPTRNVVASTGDMRESNRDSMHKAMAVRVTETLIQTNIWQPTVTHWHDALQRSVHTGNATHPEHMRRQRGELVDSHAYWPRGWRPTSCNIWFDCRIEIYIYVWCMYQLDTAWRNAINTNKGENIASKFRNDMFLTYMYLYVCFLLILFESSPVTFPIRKWKNCRSRRMKTN